MPPIINMAKIKYNQTRFLGCIDKLAHRQPINTGANYIEEMKLLYSIINEDLSLDKKGLMDLDLSILCSLEELIDDYCNRSFSTRGEGAVLFEELVKINEIKEILNNAKLSMQMATDFDFF